MSLVKNIGGFLNEWAVNTSEVPDDFRNIADKETAALTDAGRKAQEKSETEKQIERNLRGGQFSSWGATAGRWLSEPVNMITALFGAVGFIYLIVRITKA